MTNILRGLAFLALATVMLAGAAEARRYGRPGDDGSTAGFKAGAILPGETSFETGPEGGPRPEVDVDIKVGWRAGAFADLHLSRRILVGGFVDVTQMRFDGGDTEYRYDIGPALKVDFAVDRQTSLRPAVGAAYGYMDVDGSDDPEMLTINAWVELHRLNLAGYAYLVEAGVTMAEHWFGKGDFTHGPLPFVRAGIAF